MSHPTTRMSLRQVRPIRAWRGSKPSTNGHVSQGPRNWRAIRGGSCHFALVRSDIGTTVSRSCSGTLHRLRLARVQLSFGLFGLPIGGHAVTYGEFGHFREWPCLCPHFTRSCSSSGMGPQRCHQGAQLPQRPNRHFGFFSMLSIRPSVTVRHRKLLLILIFSVTRL